MPTGRPSDQADLVIGQDELLFQGPGCSDQREGCAGRDERETDPEEEAAPMKFLRPRGGSVMAMLLKEKRASQVYRPPRYAITKARTGKVPNPRTLTGTPKNRLPRSGTAWSPRKCSTIGISRPSSTVWTGRAPSSVSSML